MKTTNIAFFCITALVSFNNYAQADSIQNKKWVIQKNNYLAGKNFSKIMALNPQSAA